MQKEIKVCQSYDDDFVVLKDIDFTPHSCTEFFITCKISINDCEFFEYKTEFRDKGYEPFDGFDKTDRAYLFAQIEHRAHGNKYQVAYNLIDEPLSQLVIDFENANDGPR